MSQQITLDENQRFSFSKFWQGQRQFYHDKGETAWAGEVPFYITSNPFIANSYAKILIRFLQDWTRQHPDASKDPFYIIELGAGSGQFSYYVLNTLQKLITQFKLENLTIRYLMTDFTENNLKFWQQHERLKPFAASKLVDFALFDLERDETITTINQKIKLTANCSKNPIVVFSNYLFDSVINDIFEVKNGELSESLVTLTTPNKNLKNGQPNNWKQVKIHHTESPINANYYGETLFDETLNSYKDELKNSYLLYPIGALRGIKRLQSFANNKLLLVTSDKGYTNSFELDENDFPELDFHGSFSLMVNYHAIERYCKLCKGDSFMQSSRDGLTTCVFTSGFDLSELTETTYVLRTAVEGFSPSDFFNFYELVDTISSNADLKLLASTLCLSHWDPFIFEQIADRISALFEKETTEIIDYLVDNLPKIADNFYFVPGCDDVFFHIGVLFYAVDHYEEAIKYYKESLKYFPAEFEIYYNLGLTYYYDEKFGNAADNFAKALEFSPRHKEAKSLLKACQQAKGSAA